MNKFFVVLYEPLDDINIGSVVRAAQNFGVDDVRLVRPRVADPERISISAPNAAKAVAALKHFDDLGAALADATRVFGATARTRSAAGLVADPPQAARLGDEAEGRVALLFGREDHGLPNEALDLCDVQITIPTSPNYRSLNLAQAVLLVLWEMFRATELDHAPAGAPVELRSDFTPADRGQLERMFGEAHRALDAVGFIKYGDGEHLMRSIRSVFSRARLDERELSIWFGVFKEIQNFARRVGGDDQNSS